MRSFSLVLFTDGDLQEAPELELRREHSNTQISEVISELRKKMAESQE